MHKLAEEEEEGRLPPRAKEGLLQEAGGLFKLLGDYSTPAGRRDTVSQRQTFELRDMLDDLNILVRESEMSD